MQKPAELHQSVGDPTMRAGVMARLIAIVSSDGSGKSTVGEALLGWMCGQAPTKLCHLGKGTGNIGRSIGRWPLLGRSFNRKRNAKADKAKDPAGPSLATGIVIYLFSMLRHREAGFAILTDRFPQTEIPGPMDGLGLANAQGPVLRWLVRRERSHYDRLVGHRPDLVLRLTVDLDTALARKPDHRPSSLRTKIADLARLEFGGARIVDIDATEPQDRVLASSKATIRDLMGERKDQR